MMSSKVPSKEGGSKAKLTKWLSKAKRRVTKKETKGLPLESSSEIKRNPELKSWMESWFVGAPVISASSEFYGLPRHIVIIIWTYILEQDDHVYVNYLMPSLLEDVYHTSRKRSKFNVDRHVALSLLRINRFSRRLALEKFNGTLPVFAGENKSPGIVRFDSDNDIIFIRQFQKLHYQMVKPAGSADWFNPHSESVFNYWRAEECLKYYPKGFGFFKHKWQRLSMSLHTKFCTRSGESASCYCKLHRIMSGFDARGTKLPSQLWNLSQSIKHLYIDEKSAKESLRLIENINSLERETIHPTRYRHYFPPHGNFEYPVEPLPTLIKFLRKNGNIKFFRIAGEDSYLPPTLSVLIDFKPDTDDEDYVSDFADLKNW